MKGNKKKANMLKELSKYKMLWIILAVIVILMIVTAVISWKLMLGYIIFLAIAVFILMVMAGKFCVGPLTGFGMKLVDRDFRRKYGERPSGEIVFYGASNFTFWKTMEEDMKPWRTQNHGFGGSTDSLMYKYAPEFLYPYDPAVVFIQTGSNDNVNGLSVEEIMKNKRELYNEFRKNLPDAKFIIMSGLPLPGRQEYLDSIMELNSYLKEYVDTLDGFYFIDATDVMMKDGQTRPEYFVSDGVHLNAEGHRAWTALMREKLEELEI